MVTRRTVVKGLAIAPVAGTALLAAPARAWGQEGEPVRIGSKDFTEQLILGEMYALLLENADIPVETSLNLGGTGVAHGALVEGEIDLYPEYTGTGLTEILKIPVETDMAATPTAGTPEAGSIDDRVYQIVKDEYQK